MRDSRDATCGCCKTQGWIDSPAHDGYWWVREKGVNDKPSIAEVKNNRFILFEFFDDGYVSIDSKYFGTLEWQPVVPPKE